MVAIITRYPSGFVIDFYVVPVCRKQYVYAIWIGIVGLHAALYFDVESVLNKKQVFSVDMLSNCTYSDRRTRSTISDIRQLIFFIAI